MNKFMNDRKENSDKQIQELTESSLMGISIIRGENFIYMNSEQKRIFSPNENLLRFRDLMIHENDHQRFEQICNAIKQKKPLNTDVEIRFYPGNDAMQRHEFRHVVVRTGMIRYHSEIMTLVNMVDITHSKRMEHLALLRSKMVSLGHISVGIAHEIRSPLTGINFLIQGIRESLESSEPKEEVLDLLDQVEKATDKIETVVKRVLDYAKPSEPQVKLGNINQPILSAVRLCQAAVRNAGITLETRLNEELSDLFIDFHLMEQVFINLINNAVAALNDIEKLKVIDIASRQLENDILITVSDSGKGIPKQMRDKIFDPFFSTRKTGTGIGLSICQRIITDHGGVMTISESTYNGAQFNIRLPIEKRQFTR